MTGNIFVQLNKAQYTFELKNGQLKSTVDSMVYIDVWVDKQAEIRTYHKLVILKLTHKKFNIREPKIYKRINIQKLKD